MWTYNYNDELYHYGAKGMKWGRRRYQNPDGSLTDAGKKRYARDAREKEFGKYDESQGVYYKQSKKNGRTDLSVDADRYVTEDMQRTKRLMDSTSHMTNQLRNVSDNSSRSSKKRASVDLSHMSDKELRDEINRAMLERQYNDIFNPQKVSKGKERLGKALRVSGDVLAIGSSALGIALAIKELKG